MRRDRIRRNHTATHILHWALREVLGSHVQQAGSLVAPDRLRFDFSHHEPVTHEQLDEIERLANAQIIADVPVRHYETTKAEAERLGAIAFFGEKYGDIVRVLEAGPSIELCGGTHVHALGFIGPIKIVSEGSIGSNLRRIEAVTGDGALEYIEQEEQLLRRAGELLRAAPKELPEKVERLVEQVRALQDEVQRLKAKEATAAAGDLASGATRGVLVVRHDGLGTGELQQLAVETLRALGSGVVGLVGSADGKAAVAVAVSKDLVERGASADAIARPGGQGARWRRRARQGCRRGRRPERRRGRRPRSGSRASRRPSGSSDDPHRARARRGPRVEADRPRPLGPDAHDRVAARGARRGPRSRGRPRRDRRGGPTRQTPTRSSSGFPLSLSGREGPRRGPRGSRSRSCRRSPARRSRSWCTTSG